MIVLAVALMLLVNPGWIPFFDGATKQSIAASLQSAFGGLMGGTGMLTLANIIAALAVVALMWLACIVVCSILEAMAKKGKQRKSMAGLFTSLTKFICVIAGGVWALGILGVNLAGVFASLGIASLIIGFGAQSLIEDAISGVFIIFEGQYNIGDIIVLDEFRGTVKNIGIRTTCIEDDGGNLKIVNNSDIRNLQNRSLNRSIAVCDIGITYEARVEDVEKVILANLPAMYEKNKDVFLAAPVYKGVESLADSAVVLRVVVDATEANFFAARRRLNREMKILFDDNGIEIPFNQIVVHQAEN
ncbi:MAG: mechanosensitive ion channel, partial [Lachnospiraceae bacterium]|nr:mechanosensitive ion channel [Lachnospiraceae bacterium]